MYIIQTVFLVALFAVFINGLLHLLDKWGIRNWVALYAPYEWIAKMAGCNFCLSHHLAIIMLLPFALYEFTPIYLFIPLSVAGVINQLR